MTRTLTAIAIVLALATFGCKSKSKSNSNESKPTADQPATSHEKLRPPALKVPDVHPDLTDEDLPVPSDFEPEAEKQITEKNYQKQLSELQKEIEAEPK